MAGVKGMRDRLSSSPAYGEAVRSRIRAGLIIKKLQDHAVGNGQMSKTQIQAALGLLKKVVPDLSHQTLDGSVDVTHRLLING